eukprot:SAG31_NODE_770_length_12217_cov_2.855174_12_plen_85_part_00
MRYVMEFRLEDKVCTLSWKCSGDRPTDADILIPRFFHAIGSDCIQNCLDRVFVNVTMIKIPRIEALSTNRHPERNMKLKAVISQ